MLFKCRGPTGKDRGRAYEHNDVCVGCLLVSLSTSTAARPEQVLTRVCWKNWTKCTPDCAVWPSRDEGRT